MKQNTPLKEYGDTFRELAVSFCLFCVENYYYQGNDWWNKHYIDEALSTEELLNKFLENYGN